MSAVTLLAAAWAGWVLLLAWRHRPLPVAPGRRLVVLHDPPRRHTPGDVLEHLGRRLLRQQDPARARRLAGAAIAGVATMPLLPVAAPAVALGFWAAPMVRERRTRQRAAAEVRRTLPEVVDLLALVVGAGLNVPGAVEAVGRRGQGPVAAALAHAAGEIRLGRRCADVLDDLPSRIGDDAVRPLAAALAASERYGTPLADALDRLATELRADRRRQAEAAARQVPVKLLFPLVLCVLPAFGLLTLAPLLAGAFGSLRL